MTRFKTANHNANHFMSDYVIRKYKENILHFCAKMHIFPSEYKLKKNLNKRWHVYFYYYQNGNRQKFQSTEFTDNNQLIQINRIKDHKIKVKLIQSLKELTIHELKNDPRMITTLIYGDKAKELYPSIFGLEEPELTDTISIKNAFDQALSIKKKHLEESSYKGLVNVSDRFLKYISKHRNDSIELLTKKMILDFLNSNLDRITNRTFNNNRLSMSGILTVLKENDYIKENFVSSIKPLKTTPKINKAFSNKQRIEISQYLEKHNYHLYIFYLHIYYGLMRPKTIIRLRSKHIDLERRIFDTETKTGDFVKFITDPLFEFYSSLDLSNKNDFIFTKKEFVGPWDAKEIYRRDYITKKFKKIKNMFGLDSEYTWYSFRHSAIGNMFDAKCKELKKIKEPNYIDKSLDFIRQFTNHTTNEQTKQYLRGISTEIHVDYSKYLK